MVLIDHAVYIASREDPPFELLSALMPDIVGLTKAHPIASAATFVEKLSFMHKNLKRGLAVGPLSSTAKTWPGTAELTLLHITGAIWPSSDLNHAVITPARLLMATYLGLCRVRSLQDLSRGLFLSTLFLQYEQLSQRYVPEALNFLVNAILHLSPHQFESAEKLPGNFPLPDFSPELHRLLVLRNPSHDLQVQKCNLAKTLPSNDDAQAKVDLLGLSLDLLSRFSELYKGLDAFVEIFQPIQTVLEGIKTKKLPPSLQVNPHCPSCLSIHLLN
jgi:nucleolar protein 14